MQSKNKIQIRLFDHSEKAYADFQGALIPGVARERVIGVRTPYLRKLAAELYGTYEAKKFLASLPHEYHEENNLHAFLIEKIKDFDECIYELERFLPYVDNWATCDGMSPKAFAENREKLELTQRKADELLQETRAEAQKEEEILREKSSDRMRDAVRMIIGGLFEKCQ
jgi:3-methyladenine DNA glycosylase AlkD